MPPNDTSHAESHSTSVAPGGAPTRHGLMVAGLAMLIVGGAIVARFVGRAHAERVLARATLEAAVPSVNVIHPQAGAPNQEIVYPGIHGYTGLRSHQRLSEELACRYWDAR